MATPSSKLSLAAQFDDFCRQCKRRSSIETEFLAFVKNQEECRKQWHAVELENIRLRKELEALNSSHVELERRLAHTREVLEKEVQRRERSEGEKEAKLKQIELIREFIMNDEELRDETMEKLPFLKPFIAERASELDRLNTIDESVGSVLSISRESLDASDNSGEAQPNSRSRGKRRSGTAQPEDEGNTRKRRSQGARNCDEVDPKRPNLIATTTVTTTDGIEFIATSRFFTQPVSTVPTAPPLPCLPPTSPGTSSTHTRAGTPALTPAGQQRGLRGTEWGTECTPKRPNSTGKLRSRLHDFVSKTMMKLEVCGPCGKRIKFYKTALKCTRCRSTCHPECRDQLRLKAPSPACAHCVPPCFGCVCRFPSRASRSPGRQLTASPMASMAP